MVCSGMADPAMEVQLECATLADHCDIVYEFLTLDVRIILDPNQEGDGMHPYWDQHALKYRAAAMSNRN